MNVVHTSSQDRQDAHLTNQIRLLYLYFLSTSSSYFGMGCTREKTRQLTLAQQVLVVVYSCLEE